MKVANEVSDRDLVAEVHEAARDWVRQLSRNIQSTLTSVVLQRWQNANREPAKDDSAHADWSRRREEVRATMYNAGVSSLWSMLERAGYPRSVFGAPPMEAFDVPAHLRGEWARIEHHIRYCNSRLLRGLQQRTKHRRNLYLGNARNETTVSQSGLVRGNDGTQVMAVSITHVMDSATAAADELFRKTMVDGLRSGLLEYGFMPSNPEPHSERIAA